MDDPYDPLDWRERYITMERDIDGQKQYTAWDETQTQDIGTFLSWDEAAAALQEYADEMAGGPNPGFFVDE